MPLNLSVPELTELKPRITVIGVGGAGGNAVNNMIESALEGVEFVVANTDAQALGLSKAQKRIQLGVKTTQGLGAGSLPDIGRAAAEESLDEILEHVGAAHMLFITAGMGGGTGTGAAPVIARAAKERDILTVGVVTKPFHFEGARRMRIAMSGIEALQEHVDTLLIIPNQNLFSIANERTTFQEAFAMADQVLHSGVRGITDLMVMPGLINLDFNDVRTVMSEMGKAMMGTGEAEGDKRAILAAEAAISNPLLDEVSMKGARGVLINITGSMDMTLFEVDEAANRIRAEVDPDANIIVGSTFNQDLQGRVRVSVVATGIDVEPKEAGKPQQTTTVSVSKPWREAPLAAPPLAAPTPAASPLPTPQTAPLVNPASANPVGDVHERIRRMLTEGSVDGLGGERSPAPSATRPSSVPPAGARAPEAPRERPLRAAEEARAPRNPFREAQAIGKTSIEAALDIFKSMRPAAPAEKRPPAQRSEARRPETRAPEGAPTPRAPEASRPSQPSRGDLFDDGADAELEIPSFLRKKKTG
ncbi:cell division protein FtsZ [Amphiplicatus metriothermophilus]|uniref:Cell division protein FtsZ n=1 Tax=Amphiplicatus metriothermophilus TaxID=1519374 RepID=A0A239PSS3_9PROT|nr:cell division protein FtsZ [Amphiplicatus metriothermophilus]MBB5519260.1 cell division protein FtsZ [Amphiplicatus metriothermophilus]SNT73329.1 cell division protein FtsZ [Amphiplicatus metriothermophilus]